MLIRQNAMNDSEHNTLVINLRISSMCHVCLATVRCEDEDGDVRLQVYVDLHLFNMIT